VIEMYLSSYKSDFIRWGLPGSILLIIILLAAPLTGAEEPYRGYIYNVWEEAVTSPVGYLPERVFRPVDLGLDDLNNPEDIFVDASQNVYLLDTGNDRIIVLDYKLRKKEIITEFKGAEGTVTLNNATGIFVSREGKMYIADYGNKRVLIIGPQGNLEQEITKPQADIFPQESEFLPRKVLADSGGTVYVLLEGFYRGALVFDNTGFFLGFYGSNWVETTAQLLVDFFWKRILTREQSRQMARFVPVEYSNFDIDEEDFIYTCTPYSESQTNQLKKLNSSGMNILRDRPRGNMREGVYGDREIAYFRGRLSPTTFVDINVDANGFISALDAEKGRIFQYDREGSLLFVFGKMGTQKGTFERPVALENLGEKILVLDTAKKTLTLFRLTPFGEYVREAVALYNDGFYEEAVEPWQEVLKRNTNCELAYTGIGKALYRTEDYRKAMDYFRLGYDRRGYSEAFKEYRKETIRANFSGLISGIIVLIVLGKIIKYLIRKYNFYPLKQMKRKYKMPFYIVFHPFQGYEELKYKKNGSLLLASLIVLLWFFTAVLVRQKTGFIFNLKRLDELNVLLIALRTVVLFILWVASNWAFCTLMEGEGKATEIWYASSYALLPHIFISIFVVLLSNFLTLEEGVFLGYFQVVGQLWSLIILYIGMKHIHNYSYKKTLASMVLTVGGIAIIIFLSILVYSLFQQLYAFVYGLFSEALFRM